MKHHPKIYVLLAAAAVAFCFGALLTTGDAKPKKRGAWLRLSGESSWFWNYDGDTDDRNPSQRDWPVDLVFYYDASLTKARAAVGYSLQRPGRIEYGIYQVTPTSDHHSVKDKGTKSACYGDRNHNDTHFRVYAPLHPDDRPKERLFDPTKGWRYFVFGTAHIDHREDLCGGGNGEWHGHSERAERRVAAAARNRGCTVWDYTSPENKYHRVWGKNKEDLSANRPEATHIWQNDGWASQVRIPSSGSSATNPC